MKVCPIIIVFALYFFAAVNVDNAFGWFDETHLAVAKAAGYYKWYNAAGPDIAKIKAGDIEKYNHFFDNFSSSEVTSEMVLAQTGKYNDPNDTEGHLYGAIVASLREYAKNMDAGKYGEYHLAYCAHYLADLSQPLHNMLYDDFNKARHATNDGIVDKGILDNIDKIRKHMYPIILRYDFFEQDLAKEIAKIANVARSLGNKLKKENRDMTQDEAFIQLGKSASLLKAVLNVKSKRQ